MFTEYGIRNKKSGGFRFALHSEAETEAEYKADRHVSSFTLKVRGRGLGWLNLSAKGLCYEFGMGIGF